MAETLAIVAGSARGFGRSVALETAAKLPGLSCLLLLSRDSAGLDATAADCRLAAASSRGAAAAAAVEVRAEAVDMADLERLPHRLQTVFDQIDASRFSRVLLVCNAGSLGPLDFMQNLGDFSAVRAAIDLNVTSTAVLCSVALDRLRSPRSLVLVNVSSLAAVKAFASWGIYCAGKAARDMLFQVIAEEGKEQSDGRIIKTLNYAPGPMDTDMQREIREGCGHTPTRDLYRRLKDEGRLVDPAASAAKLVKLLAADSFESGSHLDFFDL